MPLRYPWFWLLVGWLLVAGVATGSLVPAAALEAVAASDKLMHAAAYFVLMVWFAGLYERRRHVSIALGLLALGIALDVLQAATATRSFDLRDIAANASGILCGLVPSAWVLEGWCRRVERRLAAWAG